MSTDIYLVNLVPKAAELYGAPCRVTNHSISVYYSYPVHLTDLQALLVIEALGSRRQTSRAPRARTPAHSWALGSKSSSFLQLWALVWVSLPHEA